MQATLDVPRGFGVITWDSERFAEPVRTPEGPEGEAVVWFREFERCEPALKGLFPEIEPLLAAFIRQLPKATWMFRCVD